MPLAISCDPYDTKTVLVHHNGTGIAWFRGPDRDKHAAAFIAAIEARQKEPAARLAAALRGLLDLKWVNDHDDEQDDDPHQTGHGPENCAVCEARAALADVAP